MNPLVLLTYYCLLILGASIVGGMIPVWFRLTHRVMECAVSFVAGVMLGVGLLHMLPHAIEQSLAASSGPAHETILAVMLWVLAGLMTMFFVERFFCFHHHGVEEGEVTCQHEHGAEHDAEHDHDPENGHGHGHGHDITWSGAAFGLTLHSVIAGIALAASVQHGHGDLRLAGLGTFLVILLHKPFDSMTIATLMARGGWSLGWRHLVNAVFSLAIPLGVAIFHIGFVDAAEGGTTLGYALAFAAGTFMCISLSDLLPELQFHDHDRGKLSAALLLGLALAYGVCRLEALSHSHPPALPSTTEADSLETGSPNAAAAAMRDLGENTPARLRVIHPSVFRLHPSTLRFALRLASQ